MNVEAELALAANVGEVGRRRITHRAASIVFSNGRRSPNLILSMERFHRSPLNLSDSRRSIKLSHHGEHRRRTIRCKFLLSSS